MYCVICGSYFNGSGLMCPMCYGNVDSSLFESRKNYKKISNSEKIGKKKKKGKKDV